MAKLRYAAYGSNLHPLRLGGRVPSAELLGTDFLPDRSLHFHKKGADGSGKCNILEPGLGVHVAIYTINVDEKAALDKYENLGSGYEESTIVVPEFGNCFTYQATNTHVVDDLEPYCWYHEMVRIGCHFLNFPDEYVSRINAVAPSRDPNELRRRKNWRIVETLRSAT